MKKTVWILLGMVLMLTSGCRKKNTATTAPELGEGQTGLVAAVATLTPEPTRALVLKRTALPRKILPGQEDPGADLTTQETQPPRPRIFQLKVPEEIANLSLDKTGNNYKFLAQKVPPVLPADFKIGTLQDQIAGEREPRLVALRIKAFLDALVQGNVSEDFLWIENSKSLLNFLEYNVVKQKNQPRAFRIGVVAARQSEARANLRLWGESGSSEGEIYLQLEEGQWYVSDLQIDFDFAAEESPDSREKFIPSHYHWELQ